MITRNYHNLISQTLLKIYPDLNFFAAEALAWGGLTDTEAYKKLPEWKRRIIEDNLTRYRTGLKGNPCE